MQCKQCSYLLHQKCTNVRIRKYSKDFKTGEKNLICQYCADYSSLTCDKHVYDRQNGVQCDHCNLWISRKCARLSKEEYDKVAHKGSEPWYCRNNYFSILFIK